MRDAVLEWIEALPLPDPLIVIVVAMTPIFELRGAIPVARGLLDMGAVEAYLWAVLGNSIPVPIILWLFSPFVEWTERRWAWLHRILTRLQAYSHRKHAARVERLRDLALVTFVAIPLPVTGAWSGCLAAVVFAVPKRRAMLLIILGVLIAGLVVTLFLEALGLALS
ncbi:MAG TPA: small multi-drug export protein [Acidimicrobiia bacterium]|jgi:uncharacterized membrane protein